MASASHPAPDAPDFNLFISAWEPAPARLPDDTCVWAIGDIHGHLRHFEALLAAIEALMAAAPAGKRHVVTLGDYIDRGPDSLGVLKRIAALDLPGASVTCLGGNHEEYLREAFDGVGADDDFFDFWMANGGLATLESFGFTFEEMRRQGGAATLRALRERPLPEVRQALERLKLGLRIGGYLFVHAGVHPHHPLEHDEHQRLTTIRQPFLDGDHWMHDFAVVHGHSIVGPDLAAHRVSVDSGAYWTEVLTAVELRGARARFISVTPHDSLDALRKIPGRRPLASESWRMMTPVPA